MPLVDDSVQLSSDEVWMSISCSESNATKEKFGKHEEWNPTTQFQPLIKGSKGFVRAVRTRWSSMEPAFTELLIILPRLTDDDDLWWKQKHQNLIKFLRLCKLGLGPRMHWNGVKVNYSDSSVYNSFLTSSTHFLLFWTGHFVGNPLKNRSPITCTQKLLIQFSLQAQKFSQNPDSKKEWTKFFFWPRPTRKDIILLVSLRGCQYWLFLNTFKLGQLFGNGCFRRGNTWVF